ncbi:MAG: hypothetical protein ABFS41_08015 [Myxococcota bacterium]
MARRTDHVWIVHADPEARALLRRLAGDPPGVDGGPEDFPLEGAPAPRAIVLHVDRDPAAALDFAHRASRRHPRAAWVLLRDPLGRADHAFSGLDAERLAWPAEADQLARALARAERGAPTAIRARRQRDALARRYALTLGDLGLPDLVLLFVDRLLVSGERPSSARVLLEHIAQLAEAAGIDLDLPTSPAGRSLATPRVVGREPEIAAGLAAIAAAVAGTGPALVRLVGEPGVGRGAIAAEIAHRSQLAAATDAAAVEVLRGDETALLDGLGGEPDSSSRWADASDPLAPVRAAADRALAELSERARARPVVLILAGDGGRDPRATELALALAAGGLARSVAVLATASPNETQPADRAVDIEVSPLGDEPLVELVTSMVAEPIDPAWATELGCANAQAANATPFDDQAARLEADDQATESMSPQELERLRSLGYIQ